MLKDVDIEKVFVSNRISSGEKNSKYFIGYLYNDRKVKSLHMILKTSTYVKRYDWKWWLIRKMQKNKKKDFNREPVYNENFLKTKIKSYVDEVTDFCSKKIQKVDSNYTSWAVISLDSALRKDETIICKYF